MSSRGRDPMPSALTAWVRCEVGAIGQVTDVSWDYEASRVWRVDGADGATVYVKIAAGPRHYAREVYAYRHAAAALGHGGAPQLVATEPTQQALMTTAVPGSLVKGLRLPPDEASAIHHQAGRLLRRLHDVAPGSPRAREQAEAAVLRTVTKAEVRLDRVAHLLTDQEQELVRASQAEVLSLGPHLPVGFSHGDFRERNWLWHAPTRRLGLLDFERAAIGAAVADFVWLAAYTWTQYPSLQASCLSGYGRDFTEAEARALPAFTVLAVVDDLQWAARNDDTAQVARARNALSRLARAQKTRALPGRAAADKAEPPMS